MTTPITDAEIQVLNLGRVDRSWPLPARIAAKLADLRRVQFIPTKKAG